MAEHLVDTSQQEIYPDKSIKHLVKATKYKTLSLGLDQCSTISFRKYQRALVTPPKESVYVNVYKKTFKDDGTVLNTQIKSKCKDIVFSDASSAYFVIDAKYLQEPCVIEVEWNWWQGKTKTSSRKWAFTYIAMDYMEDYASLSDSERDLCDAILNRFSLLRDNHYGNSMPNLAEDVQTVFNINDVAQEMQIACQRINGSVIQQTNYVVGMTEGTHFPQQFYNLLMVSTMIQLIRKFVYGYLETPNINGNAGIAYADRRDYYNRWKDELRELQGDEKSLLDTFNRVHINFTGSATLVGGGVFGNGGKGALLSNAAIAAVQRGWRNNWFATPGVITFNM